MKALVLIPILLAFLFAAGYIMNLVGVFGCDFASPYKCEVIRTAGIFVPPVGAVAGYFDLGQ